jgi:hypothetical protein
MFVLFALAVFTSEACSVFDERLLDNHVDASVTNANALRTPLDAGAPSVAAPGSAAPGPEVPRSAAAGSAAPRAGLPEAQAGAPAAAPSVCPQSANEDFCSTLPQLPAVPRIDGAIECGLMLRPLEPLGWNGAGPMPAKTASYAAAWRPEGLYIYVHVAEQPVASHPDNQPIYCGDAVELYVDGQGTADDDAGTYGMGTMQFVIAAPSPNASMEAARFSNGVPQGAWVSNDFHTSATPDGYSVEALITAADLGLWQWMPSDRLRFSIAIDVAGTAGDANLHCGLQAGQYFLKVSEATLDCKGEPWCDVRAFCSAGLLP